MSLLLVEILVKIPQGIISYHVLDITGTTASTIIDGVTISDGRADGDDYGFGNNDGGGIFGLENASATIRNSVVVNNVASDAGGGLIVGEDSSVNIINTIFHNNIADGGGGAVYLYYASSPNILNSLFYENESQLGGAIHINGSSGTNALRITNSTFANNSAGEGDSVYHGSNTNQSEPYDNNVFWNTEGRDDNHIAFGRNSFERVAINNSIIQGGYEEEGSESENNITEDPLFVDADNNDFRLRLTSPGIDAGDNDAINLTTDILNNPRIFNDTVDIGAYEYGVLMSINNATIEEGDSDTANAEFTVTLLDSLGEAATEEITVNYATVDNTATAGEDYTTTEGTLVFGVGDTSKTISVPIIGDELIENNETFSLELSGLTGNAAIVDDSGSGTITNDDEPKQISIT
jgi:Calx-beta domain